MIVLELIAGPFDGKQLRCRYVVAPPAVLVAPKKREGYTVRPDYGYVRAAAGELRYVQGTRHIVRGAKVVHRYVLEGAQLLA